MKLLLVDADPHLLDALSVGLPLQWPDCEVLTAPDGAAGARAFFDHDPAVVVLAVPLPGERGFAVLRAIRRASDVPVLLVTEHGETHDQVRGLELGADDYLAKPFSHLALLARLRAVLRRAVLPPPERARPDFVAGDLTVTFRRQAVTVTGAPVRLTAVEYTLLSHLVRHAGRWLPAQTLVDRVWRGDAGVTTYHLHAVIRRLRSKLEPADGGRFLETDRGVGYRFVRPGGV